jgi:hypothetical protein
MGLANAPPEGYPWHVWVTKYTAAIIALLAGFAIRSKDASSVSAQYMFFSCKTFQ